MPFSEEEIGEGMTTDPTFLTRGSRFPNEDVIVPTAFEIEKGSKSLRWRVSSCDGLRFAALGAAWREMFDKAECDLGYTSYGE